MITDPEQLKPRKAARRADLIRTVDMLTAARAEALFTSDLPTGARPTRAEATAAISDAVRIHGGTRGCAIVLAGEYGERPETAVFRMRWALGAVDDLYPKPGSAVATRWVRWSARPAHRIPCAAR
jgi:hypothetical protein